MIAAYAVLSPVNQLRLQLQFWQQIPLAVVSLAAVLFLEFYFELEHHFSNMFPALFEFFGFEVQGKWITPGKVAFLVVFMWLLVSFGLHLASKPNALNFKALYTLTERLVDERKFFELVELVIPYFRILRLADDKLLRIQKTHEWLKGFNARKTDPFAIFSQDKKIKMPLFF